MSIAFSLCRAAQQSPNSVAIREPDGARNWAETTDRVARLASGLLASGLCPGDRLAFLSANSAAYFELCHAAIWAGVLVVPLNTRMPLQELRGIIADCGASGLAFDAGFSDMARSLRPILAGSILIALENCSAQDSLSFADLLAAAPVSPVTNGADAPLGIYYTGGTTGAPKGVVLSQGAFHLTATDQAEAMEVAQGSTYLHATPFFHLADVTVGNAVTYRQGTHVFRPDLGPEGILDAIRTQGVDLLSLVPTMYHSLLDHAAGDPALRGVRNLIYGAAPISEGLLRRMLDAFPEARIKQAYGQSEIAGACIILPARDHFPGGPKLASTGLATQSVHVRISDGADGEATRGAAGEIEIAGLRHMSGYWNQPEKTAEALRNGWLRTGDIGVMDDEGYVTVVDRLKDMIVSGGENIFSAEVENALSTHPAVSAVAVIGVPDAHWGEAVHAFIVAQDVSPDPADLSRHVRNQIAAYKCPRTYNFVDALPVSGVGKIRKDILRSTWATGQKDQHDD